MIRVVIDANVWISAFLYPESIPGLVVDAVLRRRFRSILSLELVDQVVKHMTRLAFSHERIKASESTMESVSDFVEIQQSLSIILGKDSDNRILECAVEGRADYIVTGDKKHLLPLGRFEGIQIVSPRDFMTVLGLSEQ